MGKFNPEEFDKEVKKDNLDWKNKLPDTSYYWVGESAYLLFS